MMMISDDDDDHEDATDRMAMMRQIQNQRFRMTCY